MRFIEKLEKNNYILHINVKTNSKQQDIINNENYLTIHVRSKPVKNKANRELISFLKNKLKVSSNQIRIISGIKSKKKVVQINFLEEEGETLLINRLLK